MSLFTSPGTTTQLVAFLAGILAWFDPGGQLPAQAQGLVVAAMGLVVAIVHAVQAYHRRTLSQRSPAVTAPPPGAPPPSAQG